MKKLFSLGVILAMALSLFSACEPESKGAFYSLQQAYDNGWLTQEDLRSIAYYHHDGLNYSLEDLYKADAITREAIEKNMYYQNENGETIEFVPSPKNPEILDAETEKQLKQTRANGLREEGRKIKAKDVSIIEYYGIYNSCVAAMLAEKGSEYLYSGNWRVIADITFVYGTSNQIKIWKENN